jgi:hypothetical protein
MHLFHAVNPKGVVLRIFINPSSSAGFEAASLGSSGTYATIRPPRAMKDNIKLDLEDKV